MTEGAADQAADFFQSFSGHLSRRVSDFLSLLLRHKKAGSLGAIAGLAIAVVFAWKLLRSPTGGSRTSAPKRRGSPSAARSGESVPEDVSSAPSLEEGDGIELTPGQIVKKKLAGCRKMTCQLLGVILEERSPEDLQEHATVRRSAIEVLLEIAKHSDLYLMETVLDDESEERVLSALESVGLFQPGGLVKDKVLFCSTEIGRSSFVRQLEADCHADTSLEIISQLSRFIKHLLHISPDPLGQIAPNIFNSTCLEQFFSMPSV